MTVPKAFICHSSRDKGVVKPLAESLRSKGIDAWFDEWEIGGGDSLRRKIDAGIDGCDFFLAIISPNSLTSEWVQTELDAALVLKIEGQCKLVPVLLEIEIEELPPLLRGLGAIKLEPYEEGLNELIKTCHGISDKPPIGEAPEKVVIPDSGLSSDAAKIALHIAKVDKYGANGFCYYDFQETADATNLGERDMEDALDELEESSIIKLSHSLNTKPGFMALDRLFWMIDPVAMGWDAQEDAVRAANLLVETGDESFGLKKLAELAGWNHRRLNPAITLLIANEIIDATKSTGAAPFAYVYVRVTPRTRRFVKDNR